MHIKDLQKLAFETYKKNGYLDMWTVSDPKTLTDIQRIADIAEIGLITTETSEAMEDVRKHGYPMLYDKHGEEMADIIFRALNFASRKGIDMEPYLIAKNLKNQTRGERHGNKI